jgi:hypothetical protein
MPDASLTRVYVIGNLASFVTLDGWPVLIDADLAPYVAAHEWRVCKLGYVFTTYTRPGKNGKEARQMHRLHRRVAGIPIGKGEGVFTWFRGSKRDCRRSNLTTVDCNIF